MKKIEIKSRYGAVLYVAKGAADVREAVEMAVRDKANLGSADLRFANLGSADLRSANLRFADLGFANLRSADLRSADLGFANLGFANLGFANLGFANLRSANLGSADLRSADLRFADLGSANLGSADLRSANLRSADLGFADLRSADLGFADLGFANLGFANLGFADLGFADLGFANLRSANLRSADLRSAKGLRPERSNELLLLREQVGKIRAYKLVTKDLMSPIQSDNRIKYEIGSTVFAKANMDESEDCGAGINLATLPWCLNEHRDGYRILVCEFSAKDIAAIPNADGKFRVHKAKVVKELDLTEMFEAEAKEREEFEKQWAERKAKA